MLNLNKSLLNSIQTNQLIINLTDEDYYQMNRVINILKDKYQHNKKSTGTAIPIIKRIAPRPQNPFLPFTITIPVRVINIKHTANTSLNVVHQRPGL